MHNKEWNSDILVKLKAIALHFDPEHLTTYTLGLAVLALEESREILINKLKIDPFCLRQVNLPDYEIPENLADIPWPTILCVSNTNWFDSDKNNDNDSNEDDEFDKEFKRLLGELQEDDDDDFDDSDELIYDDEKDEWVFRVEDDEEAQETDDEIDPEDDVFKFMELAEGEDAEGEDEEGETEKDNDKAYGIKSEVDDEEFNVDNPKDLVEKLVDTLHSNFWYKREYYANSNEVIMTLNSIFEEVESEFSYYKEQLGLLKELIINQILDGQFSNNQINPLPIVICSFEANNISPILNYIAQKMHYKFNFIEETLSLSDHFNYNTMFPFTMDVIRFSDKKTDFTDEIHKLLDYYETGIFQHSFEAGSSEDFYNFLSDSSKKETEDKEFNKDFFFRNHLIIFLLQIDSDIDVDFHMSNEKIKTTITSFYKDSYLADQHEGIYNTYNKYKALFKSIKSEKLILFDYGDTRLILVKVKDFVDSFLARYPEVKLILAKDIEKIIFLNVLKVGGFDLSSLKLAISHSIYKLNQLLLFHNSQEKLNQIIFEVKNTKIKDFMQMLHSNKSNYEIIQYIEDNFLKHSQKLNYRIEYDQTQERCIFTDLNLETIIREGSNLTQRPEVRFKDVIGCEEVKKRFAKIIDYYKDKSFFLEKGIKMSNRILLIGPPGTGKTMVAKAFAGEIGLPFYAISAAEVTSQQWAGWGASLLRKIFYKAKKNKPCVVFLDEIDAFGNRGQFNGDDGGVGYDAKSIMNTLLVLLDGVEDNNDVIVIGATNRPEDLDDALIRSKRFGLKFEIKALTSAQRIQLIKLHLKEKNVQRDYEKLVTHIKDRTYGEFSAAKIVELIEETQIYALIDKKTKVTANHFDYIIDKFILGEKISNLNPDYKKNVAIHEAGHAVIHQMLFPENSIQSLSLGLRKSSVGITLYKKENSDNGYEELKNTEIINHIVIALAGMQAEKIMFGHWDLGSSDDFVVATHMSLQLACNLDLGKGISPVIDYSLMVLDLGSKEISQETKEILHELVEICSQKANELLRGNWEYVLKLAGELEEKEDLNWEDIRPLLGGLKAYRGALVDKLMGVEVKL